MPASSGVNTSNPTPLQTDFKKLVSNAPAICTPIDGIVTGACFKELCQDAPSIATGKMTGTEAIAKAIPLNTAG
jgi:hypothetical protein